MQLGSCDPVGDDDALLGSQGLGDIGQEFVLVVLVRLRRLECGRWGLVDGVTGRCW